MANRLDRQIEKGVELAAMISDQVMVKHAFTLSFRVTTSSGYLTRVDIWRKVEEPDAAGQGGRAPSS